MFDDDLETRIREKAARQGLDVAGYVRDIIDTGTSGDEATSIDERIALLHQGPPVAKYAREIPDEALRRENLYEDRA